MSRTPSLHISFALCSLTVCGFLAACPQVAHWFLVPVLCCGVIIGCDAVDWLLGRTDLFDPAGVIGLFGLHFFFLTPLLHVAWNSWTVAYVDPPPDWRDWLGAMAIINAGGLLLYRTARIRAATWGKDSRQTFWRLSRQRLLLALVCGLAVSALLQVWFYAQHGGISGYIEEYSQSIGLPEADSPFRNTAWIFMVSERFPILAMIGFAVFCGRSRIAKSWIVLGAVLLIFFVLQMLFGGLRGSRAATIWSMLWAAGIIHFWVRPLKRNLIFPGLALLIVFMNIYSVYKEAGADTLATLQDASKTAELRENRERTLDDLILGDLGRADVQAFLLYRLSMPRSDYKYALGRTYLGGLAILVPRAFLPDRPPTKVREGTEAQFGAGSWDELKWSSSKVYGLAGEALLNFGPLIVPLAYLIFGLIVGRLQRFIRHLDSGDMRLLFYPFLLTWCLQILISDSDDLVFALLNNGFVPSLIVWLGSRIEFQSASPSTVLQPS